MKVTMLLVVVTAGAGCGYYASPFTTVDGELIMIEKIDQLNKDETFAIITLIPDWDKLEDTQRHYVLSLVCNRGKPVARSMWLDMMEEKMRSFQPPIPTVPGAASKTMIDDRTEEYIGDVQHWLDAVREYLREEKTPENLIGELVFRLDPLPVDRWRAAPEIMVRREARVISLPAMPSDRFPLFGKRVETHNPTTLEKK